MARNTDTDDVFEPAEVEPTDEELRALEEEEEEEEPFDDGPDELPADVVKGSTEMIAENDLADRLMALNQTLYTTLKLVKKASPRVVAGVFSEIAELHRLAGKLPRERPRMRKIGFQADEE